MVNPEVTGSVFRYNTSHPICSFYNVTSDTPSLEKWVCCLLHFKLKGFL